MGKVISVDVDSKKQNLSLGKAMGILDVMVTYSKPVRLLDIANDTGMTSSTVYRFLNAFIESGFVRKDESTQLYSLTLKLAFLGHMCRQNYQIVGNLQKYVDMIAEHFNESASLCVEEDMQVVYVATREGPSRMLSTLSRIGKIAPMHCTGTGKIFLTQYSDTKLNELVKRKGLERFTPKTICNIDDLKNELDCIRNRGFSWDDEECELGAKCMAIPIYDYTGKIIASLSFSCPIQRFPDVQSASEFMRNISLQASSEFGFTGL